AAGEAAAGRELREGGVPDRRAAGQGEGGHHQAMGRGGRREREISRIPIEAAPRRPCSRAPDGAARQNSALPVFRGQEEQMRLAWVRMIPISALALLACAGSASATSMDKLIADAKAEGQLTVIALPHDWCGYGAVIDGFKAKYGLKVNELNPDAGSGDEIEAIKANKGNAGPQAPDVIDV